MGKATKKKRQRGGGGEKEEKGREGGEPKEEERRRKPKGEQGGEGRKGGCGRARPPRITGLLVGYPFGINGLRSTLWVWLAVGSLSPSLVSHTFLGQFIHPLRLPAGLVGPPPCSRYSAGLGPLHRSAFPWAHGPRASPALAPPRPQPPVIRSCPRR
ncbi:unnamed protein product [Prunus armeniaca]|uniref:Uncharacterized protein n=1 Tax=Prunus armeniaca TaxID=36596 RepID=A0A6J5TVY4_PRUAR|nr:unnamed protein product [Prunus armeniaca]